MQIEITNGSVRLTRTLRQHIEQRVGLALGRFAERIRLIKVALQPAENTDGKKEKLCRIEVAMRKKVLVEARHKDTYAAVNQAVDHALRRVVRILEKEHTPASPAAVPAATPRKRAKR